MQTKIKFTMVEFLKTGNNIHIKESKKGSFTRWCGGEVTEECIRKGKNSSNKAIRKKATFADNARKWKQGGSVSNKRKINSHLNGGTLSKVGNWINNNPELINTALNGISSIISANKLSAAAELYALAKKEEMKSFINKTWAEKYKEALKNLNDRSNIVNMSRAFNLASGDVAQEVQEHQELAESQIENSVGLSGSGWGELIAGIANSLLTKKANNTVSTNSTIPTNTTTNTTNSNNFWTNPTLGGNMNSFSNPNTFWNF